MRAYRNEVKNYTAYTWDEFIAFGLAHARATVAGDKPMPWSFEIVKDFPCIYAEDGKYICTTPVGRSIMDKDGVYVVNEYDSPYVWTKETFDSTFIIGKA